VILPNPVYLFDEFAFSSAAVISAELQYRLLPDKEQRRGKKMHMDKIRFIISMLE